METNYDGASEQVDYYLQVISDYAIDFGLQILAAIVVLIIGFRIIKVITRATEKAMNKSKIDTSLMSFLKSLINISLKVVLIIIVASMVGIQTTSLIAVVGAASLAIGIALQGSLSNFAGGVILLFLKPFKVGDFIEGDGYMGTVSGIQLFYTVLNTVDNKRVIIPNGKLSNNSITNFSFHDTRRVDFKFGIGYSDDIDQARKVIEGIIAADSRILKDPESFVAVSELADSSVNFVVRVWANAGDYWGIYFDMIENVKKSFDKEGVSIPFPQTDVHLHQVK
nr:mechanosensitive ion channel [Bacteroidota bacterium]